MQVYEDEAPLWAVRSQLLWFLTWLFVTGVGMYLTPSTHGHGTHQQLGLPPCPSVLLFDRPCPGCGLTTSWTALIHGQVITSFKAHPLGPLLYGIFSLVGLGTAWGNIKGKKMNLDSNWANRIFVGTIAVFFVFGLARMAFVTHYAGTTKELIWRGALRP